MNTQPRPRSTRADPSANPSATPSAKPSASRGRMGFALLLGTLALAIPVLVGLGVWQLDRRVWKLALIARVDARVHAAPQAPPGPKAWPSLAPDELEYRHVVVSGRFLDREALVQAVSDLGAGEWVMVPLLTDAGYPVLVNRGFVSQDERADRAGRRPVAGPVSVTGLLRLSEPGGAFLRPNDPAAGRWTSRDVGAIATALGLVGQAPFFIDAEAGHTGAPADGAATQPVGGLTVVDFRNEHLAYALTWFALAGMAGLGIGVLVVQRRRSAGSGPAAAMPGRR